LTTDLTHYAGLLGDIKPRIRQAQINATLSANAEMIFMYWDIGRMILERQKREGWGAAVIPRLFRDIRNDLPEVKGFSERNIGYMIRFSHEYGASPILQQPVAKLPGSSANSEKVPQPVAQMPPTISRQICSNLLQKFPGATTPC